MNELALFAGAGGGILGGKLLGWRTVAAVEWEPYPTAALIQRQNEGVLENFPIWDDVRTFNGKDFQGIIDVVSGGFPCQDISSAGKGAGLDGERSSMWYHMLRIIQEVRPKYAFIENSPNLRTRGLVTCLQGLAKAGYDAAWGVLSAEDCGANHKRKRMWILAEVADTSSSRCQAFWKECRKSQTIGAADAACSHSRRWWQSEPSVGRVADGVAYRMDRLKAIGNGQVPIVAATAFLQLKNALDNRQKGKYAKPN